MTRDQLHLLVEECVRLDELHRQRAGVNEREAEERRRRVVAAATSSAAGRPGREIRGLVSLPQGGVAAATVGGERRRSAGRIEGRAALTAMTGSNSDEAVIGIMGQQQRSTSGRRGGSSVDGCLAGRGANNLN